MLLDRQLQGPIAPHARLLEQFVFTPLEGIVDRSERSEWGLAVLRWRRFVTLAFAKASDHGHAAARRQCEREPLEQLPRRAIDAGDPVAIEDDSGARLIARQLDGGAKRNFRGAQHEGPL